jgi:hypothetical protein
MNTCMEEDEKLINENLLDGKLLDELMLLDGKLLVPWELDLCRHDFRSCTLTADDAGDCLRPAE